MLPSIELLDTHRKSIDTGENNDSLEQQLEAAIEPWLVHMTWRPDFAAWRERRLRQELYQADNVKDVLRALRGQPSGKMVLDLGAGMGGLSVALLRELGPQGARIEAMDYNPDYSRIARLRAQRYGLSLPVVVAAGEQLPYSGGLFDLVVCMDVLEHVADAHSVLIEMYRILKPGGVVVTTVPNRRAFRDPHYHLPFINWLPTGLAERIIELSGRSKSSGPLNDRQGFSELNTFTWARFERLARSCRYRVQDRVYSRITSGEIRQLTGWRRRLLDLMGKTFLLKLAYRLYRYGWQGTYQIILVKSE